MVEENNITSNNSTNNSSNKSSWIKNVYPKLVHSKIEVFLIPGSNRSYFYCIGVCELDGKFYSLLYIPTDNPYELKIAEVKYDKGNSCITEILGDIPDDEEYAVIVNWFLENRMAEINEVVAITSQHKPKIPGSKLRYMWRKKGNIEIVPKSFLDEIEKRKNRKK